MEAGNRCFDECLPEETNRRIVDVTSDVNLCYSEHARRYLNAAGVPKDRTFVVGSPMAEVLRRNLLQIEASDIHARLGLEKGKYILLSPCGGVDSPDRGNVCEADKRVPEFGEFCSRRGVCCELRNGQTAMRA